MAGSYYEPGEQRATKVNELFNRIAPRYDLINDLQSFWLHRLWKKKVVSLARVQPGTIALDLCCGTGDLAFALAARGASVTGVDFSEAMLKVAEERKKALHAAGAVSGTERGRPRPQQPPTGHNPQRPQEPLYTPTSQRTGMFAIQSSGNSLPVFVRADALSLPFPDRSFDIVTIGYGLRNLADWERGLREMHRVLKPGGRMLVLDFGKPPNRIWRGVYFAYLRLVVPWFGRIFCGNKSAYAYILESLEHYPAQVGVAEGMRRLGLSNMLIINLLGGIMSVNYAEKPE